MKKKNIIIITILLIIIIAIAGYFVAQKNPIAFEEYEKQFPPKEKLRLSGQIF